jgi:hypothetical protein
MSNAELAAMLRAMAAKVGPSAWAHRPQEYDDWGTIRMTERDEFGFQRWVCKCAFVASPDELTEHRTKGTDPSEPVASLIVALRNNLPAIIAALEKDQDHG